MEKRQQDLTVTKARSAAGRAKERYQRARSDATNQNSLADDAEKAAASICKNLSAPLLAHALSLSASHAAVALFAASTSENQAAAVGWRT